MTTKLTLTQPAYIAGTNNDPYYTASATDADGNKYNIRWEINNPDFVTETDESNNCDWHHPAVIYKDSQARC